MLTRTISITGLPWPTHWSNIFGREAPLLVEIGFGNSTFLVDLARRNQDSNLLGLEISFYSMEKGERKMWNAGLKNVRFIQAQAQVALWLLFATRTIKALFINFPDPWPKLSHHRRRLINDRFLHLVATRMLAEGTVDIATDHAEYAEWIYSCLERSPFFISRLGQPFVTSDDDRIKTKYEKKALAEGRTCYYFKWQRNSKRATNVFFTPQESPMPHVLIQIPLSQKEISRKFQPAHFSTGSISVRMIDLYWSKTHDSIVVDTFISEEPLEQRLLLQITRRETGDRLVNLHDVGFPRPTPGVHFALQCLAGWICDLHEESAITNQNLLQVDLG